MTCISMSMYQLSQGSHILFSSSSGLRRQFAINLEEAGMVMSAESCFNTTSQCNENSDDVEIIKVCSCSSCAFPLIKQHKYHEITHAPLTPNCVDFWSLCSCHDDSS